MDHSATPRPENGPIRKVAVLGNHTPRQCGIATFTADLSEAISSQFPGLDCFVLAMNDAGKSHAYPERVRFEIAENDLRSYRRAADFLNVNAVDVLSLQHEYGIFGGKAGSHVFDLLREIRIPIVTTLHTILAEPNPLQRAAMEELTRLSSRLVVMSERGAELLSLVYGVPSNRVDLIPHGIPVLPMSPLSKKRRGVEDRRVVLTFGLLSPDKGIEYVIDALPAVLERYPEALYIVLGATHPHIKDRHGETYRLMLENRVQKLGLESSVIFYNRFVGQEELTEFLSAADVYVTPYLKAEQITSGTLAYAVGSGKAVVSTPYWYARELLADGRGVLVPWKDPASIAGAIVELFADDAKRLALCERAAVYGRNMIWPAVARRYGETFERARVEYAERLRTEFRASTLASRPAEPPEPKLDHVRLMTDNTGMLQHAAFSVPRYEDGYCLDDNARALVFMALLEDADVEDRTLVRTLESRYLAFVRHAWNGRLARFRNFMSYGREWQEQCGSEDSHGRALWALGTVVGRSIDPGRQSLSGELFHAALPAVSEFSSPRAWAFVLIGIDEYLRAFQGDTSVQAVRLLLSERLHGLYRKTADPAWPWFEDRLTYCNARLPQALLLSGARMGREDMVAAGLRSLEWLLSVQRSADGYFAPVGSNGFYLKDASKAEFDQQPVEASGTISACIDARRVTNDERWVAHARRAFNWYLGQNQLQQTLYDATTGGCRDGLHPDRVNENQGAESTLSFLLALLDMRSADRLAEGRVAPVSVDATLQNNRRFVPVIAAVRGRAIEPETNA
jgi:glycosyltransferase involved in cell wall biosynthesis